MFRPNALLRPLFLTAIFGLGHPLAAHAGDENVETTDPITEYIRKANVGIGVPFVVHKDWDEACVAASPGCIVDSPFQTRCYSGGHGGFSGDAPGCFYHVTITNTQLGGIIMDDDVFEGGWVIPGAACPNGGWTLDADNSVCKRTRYVYKDCSNCTYGDPVSIGTGQSTRSEVDLAPLPGTQLSITREYSSFNSGQLRGAFGPGWFLMPFDRRLFITNASGVVKVQAVRSISDRIYFTQSSGLWTTTSDKQVHLSQTASGWTVQDEANQTLEEYSADGQLQTVRDAEGAVLSLTYSTMATPITVAPFPGLLIQVTDNFGRSLAMGYNNAGRVVSITDPSSQQYQYAYDPSNGALASVTYPDQKTRTYLYEIDKEPARLYLGDGGASAVGNPMPLTMDQYNKIGGSPIPPTEVIRRLLGDYDAYPLTGVMDENGVRHSSYTYDDKGKALSTEEGNGLQKYSFVYGDPAAFINQITVTDPLGTIKKVDMIKVQGTAKPQTIYQAAGAGSNAATRRMDYDANGNIASATDFLGVRTTYTFDLTRNLETNRVEANGTVNQRTINTQWHPNWRLPTKVAEPNRITTYLYNGLNGASCAPASAQISSSPIPVLCTKTVQATSDANGSQGFSAAPVGTARVWAYTYNAAGQVLTATDPNNNVASYGYDGQGNLATVQNAAGQVTQLLNYDGNGRVGRIIDPNNLITDLSYYPRGWIKTKVVNGNGVTQTTSYAYDNVGNLTSVTLPDGSSMSYTYDAAYRLTSVADSLGNSVTYTLDNAGNRLSDQTKDPQGNLTRQITRVFDALSRLQQITGGVQ